MSRLEIFEKGLTKLIVWVRPLFSSSLSLPFMRWYHQINIVSSFLFWKVLAHLIDIVRWKWFKDSFCLCFSHTETDFYLVVFSNGRVLRALYLLWAGAEGREQEGRRGAQLQNNGVFGGKNGEMEKVCLVRHQKGCKWKFLWALFVISTNYKFMLNMFVTYWLIWGQFINCDTIEMIN